VDRARAPPTVQLGEDVGGAREPLVGDAVVQHHHRQRPVDLGRRGDAKRRVSPNAREAMRWRVTRQGTAGAGGSASGCGS
jgi:hypothetical protein